MIVQTERLHDGSRKITEIVEVTGISERGDIQYQHLFKFVPMGESEDHKVIGRFEAGVEQPAFLDKAITYGLDKELLSIMRTAMEQNQGADKDDGYTF